MACLRRKRMYYGSVVRSCPGVRTLSQEFGTRDLQHPQAGITTQIDISVERGDGGIGITRLPLHPPGDSHADFWLRAATVLRGNECGSLPMRGGVFVTGGSVVCAPPSQ